MNQSINDGGDCITALATPGLLNILLGAASCYICRYRIGGKQTMCMVEVVFALPIIVNFFFWYFHNLQGTTLGSLPSLIEVN